MVKAILLFCATALIAQVYGQCLGRAGIRAPLAYEAPCGCGARRTFAYDAPCGYADIAAASSLNAACGGAFGVTSGSSVPPTGLNVASENVYEGSLALGGNLPFLGTVAVEGAFPSIGAGGISYGCGDGAIGITAETNGAVDFAGIGYNGLAYDGLGHNGLAYDGLGYNGLGYNGLGYNGLACDGLGYRGYAGRLGGCGCGAF